MPSVTSPGADSDVTKAHFMESAANNELNSGLSAFLEQVAAGKDLETRRRSGQ